MNLRRSHQPAHGSVRLRVVAILISAALGIGSMVAMAPQASAAGCYGRSCAGWDPVARGCSVTSTTSSGGTWGTLWNRYSSGCKANWARGQLSAAALAAGDTMWLEITTTDSAGQDEYICWPNYGTDNQGLTFESCYGASPYGGSSIVYSDMVDGTNITHADMIILHGADFVAEYQANQ